MFSFRAFLAGKIGAAERNEWTERVKWASGKKLERSEWNNTRSLRIGTENESSICSERNRYGWCGQTSCCILRISPFGWNLNFEWARIKSGTREVGNGNFKSFFVHPQHKKRGSHKKEPGTTLANQVIGSGIWIYRAICKDKSCSYFETFTTAAAKSCSAFMGEFHEPFATKVIFHFTASDGKRPKS